MLIKEYHIPMPLSVEEYKIAQLYMIQKKSRQESQGKESGVEILENQPYTDGPGGNGQYTRKIYHISKHIPGWLVPLLPKDALMVVEEAWNAYPYTRTRHTCPFVEKFSIDIETKYIDDAGETENVFNLSHTEMRAGAIDVMDIVKEQASDYKKDEDPKLFKSAKTGRGPLSENWLTVIKRSPPESRGKVMCAYKRCKVEFKYWGMQSKIEKFIHDTGLRKVMLRAHKQAWCWQDEWFGLSIKDIRRLEKETQLALRLKFDSNGITDEIDADSSEDAIFQESESDLQHNMSNAIETISQKSGSSANYRTQGAANHRSYYIRHSSTSSSLSNKRFEKGQNQLSSVDGRIEDIRRYSTGSSSDDDEYFDAQDGTPEPPFLPLSNLIKYRWGSSVENLAEPISHTDLREKDKASIEYQRNAESETWEQRDSHSPDPCKIDVLFLILHGGNALEWSNNNSSSVGLQSTKQSDLHTLQTTFDAVIHAHYKAVVGRIAMRLVSCPAICTAACELLRNLSPVVDDVDETEQTLSSALISLFATSSSLYNDSIQSLSISCNLVYSNFIESEEGKGFLGKVCVISDTIGSILSYDMLCKCYTYHLNSPISSRRGSSLSNHEEEEEDESVPVAPSSPTFRVSPPQQFEFQPSIRRGSATPSLGSNSNFSDGLSVCVKSACNTLLPSLSTQRRASAHSFLDIQRSSSYAGMTTVTQTALRSNSNTASSDVTMKLDFEVAEFFMLGSPLGLILAMRQITGGHDTFLASSQAGALTSAPPQPACNHIYNLFYTADPSSARIEPLLDTRLSSFSPVRVVKYQMFPLGDGQSLFIGDFLSSSSNSFADTPNNRRASDWSIGSGYVDQQASGNIIQSDPMHDSSLIIDDDTGVFKYGTDSPNQLNSKVVNRWWGEKRIDYALFYPEALTNFPASTLPHLFHASFWESTDVAAFVLQQLVKHDHVGAGLTAGKQDTLFSSSIPREKWQRRRTPVKLRNVTANHRAKDAVTLETNPYVITGKFMYGPLDVVQLTGEKVDLYVMTQPPASEWMHVTTEVTSGNGKISFTFPDDKKLGVGFYPIKMVVRGDHTMADSYLAVVPPQMDCVIFSIDGSFTASVSIMGSDPKVRPGAVDVVRFWQDLGYMIIYVTGRPDMQKHKVVTWLAQHNFPHGLIWFGDGLSHDPLKQKMLLLKTMKFDHKLNYAAAYGSSKDIGVYSHLELPSHRIFIVGKTSKKQSQQCRWLCDGYSAHLTNLKSSEDVNPAKFRSQKILRKECFGLPGQTRKRRPSSKRKKVTS